LFGASAPLSKLLFGEVPPTLMASFLYLGSGIGLCLQRYLRSSDKHFSDEAGLIRHDWPWLIGAVSVGGIAAPIVIIFSLKNTPAATASLLLKYKLGLYISLAVVIIKTTEVNKK